MCGSLGRDSQFDFGSHTIASVTLIFNLINAVICKVLTLLFASNLPLFPNNLFLYIKPDQT